MADLRTDFELSQKQIEVDLLNEKQGKQRITVTSAIVALSFDRATGPWLIAS